MTSLTLVRRIAAAPDVVFDAMTTAEGIAHWWGPDAGPVLAAEIDLRVGGRFSIRFRMLDGTDHESHGEFLEVARPSRFSMTWQWLGREAEGTSRVVAELKAVGGGTELVFTHERLDSAASRDDHERGWTGALDKLEAYLSPQTKARP